MMQMMRFLLDLMVQKNRTEQGGYRLTVVDCGVLVSGAQAMGDGAWYSRGVGPIRAREGGCRDSGAHVLGGCLWVLILKPSLGCGEFK